MPFEVLYMFPEEVNKLSEEGLRTSKHIRFEVISSLPFIQLETKSERSHRFPAIKEGSRRV
jgi:hypothetical protein